MQNIKLHQSMKGTLMNWTSQQKYTALSCYLAWVVDAFDFFIMVFVLGDIAKTFDTTIKSVAVAITMTLAFRVIGAILFGRLADKFGRKPILIVNIAFFTLFEVASALATSLPMFLVIRALFGIAMGGAWGVASALVLETIPSKGRGIISGILQSGYPSGYLFASIIFGLLHPVFDWRGLFVISLVPAFIVLVMLFKVSESPAWQSNKNIIKKSNFIQVISSHWKVAVYGVLLMTAFNFFSHGSQDLYPTYLEIQRGLDTHEVSIVAIIYNIGAIIGGITFGWLSEQLGRQRTAICAALLAVPLIPLWTMAPNIVILAIGAFAMQFVVQGAWGIIPAYLNEISPIEIRAVFPGLVYQLGNLLASSNASIQTFIATNHNGNYSMALSLTIAIVAIVIAGIMFLIPCPKNHLKSVTE